MTLIKLDPNGIPVETATALLEEFIALEPIDIPAFSMAVRDLDSDELEILSAVLSTVKRKINNVRGIRRKGMSHKARLEEDNRIAKMLTARNKNFPP